MSETRHESALPSRPLTVFLLAGEESGDQLGAALMRSLAAKATGIRFIGVGGARMEREGLHPLFPMQEIGLHGIAAVVTRIPSLLRRRREAVEAVLKARPDVLVTIDIPDFNLGVARMVRHAAPEIPTLHYIMPSVWAYRPGRAAKMARWIDRVLSILPFEPAVVAELGGPPCSYIGHSLTERLDELRPVPGERKPLGDGRPTLLVLPGSRRSEIRRLLKPFGETLARIVERTGPLEVVLPAVAHLREEILAGVAEWKVKPTIVEGEAEKFAAFRRANAALAASGTVTLELALSGVPMVVAYRIDPLFQWIRLVFRARTIVLANLVLEENVVPEFIDWNATPEKLSAALLPLLGETPERRRQVEAFARLDGLMEVGGTAPSARAAGIVLETIAARQRRLESGT